MMGQTHPVFGLESGKALGLCTALALAWAAAASAEDVLKDKGLLRSGSFYVLEAEAVVHTELYEAQRKFEPFLTAYNQLATIVEGQQTLKNLDLQRIALRRKIDDINVQLG